MLRRFSRLTKACESTWSTETSGKVGLMRSSGTFLVGLIIGGLAAMIAVKLREQAEADEESKLHSRMDQRIAELESRTNALRQTTD